MNLLVYFGLINCIFIPLAIYFLWVKNDRFYLFETPISYAGITNTKRQFVYLTCIGVIFELLFVTAILYSTKLMSDGILLSLAVVGFLGIFLTAFTPHGHPRLHRAGIRVMITAMTFWSVYLHYVLLDMAKAIAYLGLTLSLSSFIGVPYFYFYIKSKGFTELFFITIVVLWNILMTYFLLNLPLH